MPRLRSAIAVLLLLVAAIAQAQTSGRREMRREAPVPADAVSVDSILAALYASVSHGPEAAPDFERLRGIFLYTGMFVPPKRPGQPDIMATDVDGFADRYRKAASDKEKKTEGFFEREIGRRLDCFGNLCQAFSTYESRHAASDAKPFERGINSIQLVRDGKRWWIASVAWDAERADNPIPEQYLSNASAR